MSQQFQWEAYRYVLDDPTLDRQAFEERMLDDEALARAVADAMQDVELLQLASQSCEQLPVSAPSPKLASSTTVTSVNAVGHWRTLASLAAGLLLALGLGAYSLNWINQARQVPPIASNQNAIAQQWLALSEAEPVDSMASEFDTADVSSDPVVDTALPDEDWLIEAAREFYAEGAAS